MAEPYLDPVRLPERGSDGRFGRRFDNLTLCEIVRAVCAYVAATTVPMIEPTQTTQAAYDAARAPAGYAGTPRAYRIVEQLGLPWTRLVAAAFSSDASLRQQLIAAARSERRILTLAEVADALQLVSRRLGVKTLRREQYAEQQQTLAAEQARHWLHGQYVTRLPTLEQIDWTFGWAAALKAAELETPPTTSERGLPHAEAVEMFLKDLGYLPGSIHVLWAYGKAKGIAIADHNAEGGHSIAPALATVRKQWQQLGRWVPPRPARGPERPPWNVQPIDDARLVQRKNRSWSIDDCRASLLTALRELKSADLKQRQYRAHAKGRRDLVPPSRITAIASQHGTTFSKLRQEAIRIRLQEQLAEAAEDSDIS